ncbi:unnamed protein product [Vicia faba]|uniref:DUF4283 domain-containing protein n=1 Tax=Vicia faba TaxID=3906 RepID=A0AAV0ZEL8_VICFA|nr:unnamed protein product [Vicia faba]
MIQAWGLKNNIEGQDMGNNLFLFDSPTKRDVKMVLKGEPWNFDKNIFDFGKSFRGGTTFGPGVYDLPLNLRSETMAKQLGDIVGKFEEIDPKDTNMMRNFMRIKVKVDLRKLHKRGMILKYQERRLKLFFKYDILATFCFVCERIIHQLKDCEEIEKGALEGYNEIKEQDLSSAPWLRASPLPRNTE